MAHGGTTFGLWGGCDRPFRPDTTSYDYDAPIGEAGWIGAKFAAYRAAITPFLAPGETLPEPPPRMPVMAIAPFVLSESVSVSSCLPVRAIDVASPRPIELDDISRGLVSYRATLPAGPAAVLEAAKVRDLAWIRVDGELVGTWDTRQRRFKVAVPARAKPVTVDILLYTIARVNFGVEVHDRKGVHGPVTLRPADGTVRPVENWTVRAIDFDADGALPPLAFKRGRSKEAAFWRGGFDAGRSADTFLDMSGWGQGVVWINGRCLGRYWSIGPTQTMYLPGPWIKRGRNEVVVLDLTGPRVARIAGLAEPILDRLQPALDLARPASNVRLHLDGATPVHVGEFAPGAATQDVRFAAVAHGRQLCLESLDAFDGKQFAAVAELALLDATGKTIEQSAWTVAYASSEELEREDGSALNAINGQASDYWITARAAGATHPHRLVLDLGHGVDVAGLRYTPRQGKDGVTGRIRHFRVYVGDRLASEDAAVANA
jgi:beta-galactosidase